MAWTIYTVHIQTKKCTRERDMMTLMIIICVKTLFYCLLLLLYLRDDVQLIFYILFVLILSKHFVCVCTLYPCNRGFHERIYI